MDEKLKSFLEENKLFIKYNRWCELYAEANKIILSRRLANFLCKGLGPEIMISCFSEEDKIPKFAFYTCEDLERVTIPNNVTSIGDYAFSGCSKLKEITIGDSVTYIGDDAFYECESLPSVEIPDSVTSIGVSAFGHCCKLKSITIPNSVTTIGRYAFTECTCHIIFECDKKVVTDWALRGFEGTYEFR